MVHHISSRYNPLLTKREIRIGLLDYSNSWARIQQSLLAKGKKKEKNNPKDDDHTYVGKKQLQVQGHNSNIFKVIWVLINFFMLSGESVELCGRSI